jgi:hypothetical protein
MEGKRFVAVVGRQHYPGYGLFKLGQKGEVGERD